MKRHLIVLGAHLVLLALNITLLVRIQHERAGASQDFADLEKLAARVDQQSEKLKALAGSLPPCEKSSQQSASVCSVIHKPQSGCPNGYVEEKRPRFTERDGSKQFACISDDPKKQGCLDVLKPGETVEMFFEIDPDAGAVPAEGPKT